MTQTTRAASARVLTLFDVIAAIHDLPADDRQASAILQTLLRSGAVRRWVRYPSSSAQVSPRCR